MAIKLRVHEDKVKLKIADSTPLKLKASSGVPIYPEYYTGDYEITPTESEQSLEAHGLMMTDDVTVHAIAGDYVGSEVTRRSSTDLNASGATVTAPSGYYAESASKSVQSGSATTPTGGITANPTISVDSNGLITASVSKSESITPIISEGYVTEGTAGTITFSGSNTSQLLTQGATTITPSTSEQTAVSAGKYTTGEVKVSAMPTGAKNAQVNTWGWTSTTKKLTITFPNATSGYYTGTQAGAVTPVELTRQTESVTPTESSQEVTPTNGTYYIEKVTVDAIPSDYVGSGVTQRSSSDLTASGATVTTPSGYYAESASKAVASGSAKPAASISASSANKTIGNSTITLSKTVANTPQVTAGYVSSGTQGNTSIELTASMTTKGATTYHPSTTDQSVSATTYLTGAQTFKAVTTSNLTAENIKDGVTVKIGDSTDDDCVTSVTGSYTGETPNLQAKTNINPTTSSQTITADNGYDGLSSVQINAMPSGTEGTPTATKGTVSSHAISVTPSVTNVAGYISGGTHNGTAVSVSASELVSGTKSITANGTNIDVTNYASVDVSVSSGAPVLETVTKTYTPTTSQQTDTITPSTGYDGIGEVDVTVSAVATGTAGTPTASKGAVNNHSVSVTPSVTNTTGYITGSTKTGTAVSVSASELVSGTVNITSSGNTDVTNYATASVASGSATAPSTISGTSATVSTGTNTLTLSKTVSVTPSVSAGYISSGTAGNSNVSLTASVTTQAAQTIYPSISDQSIAASRYLTGAQTIKAVTTSNLTAENIKSGVTVTVGDSANASRVASVTGTYTGGGGSSDVKIGTLTVASNINTSTSTKITDTTEIGFTPTKFFFWKDSRTATSNHLHQATFTTIGSYYIRTMTRYSSNALSTSGNTNNWTTQTAGYLYYNSNTIYIRSSSSYILSSGTWHWVAVK